MIFFLLSGCWALCSSTGTKNEDKNLFENKDHVGGDGRSGGHMLRHFFDDWSRSLQEPDNAENNGITGRRMNSATCLSISTPGNTTSSDVSLKLSTGYGGEDHPCPKSDQNVDNNLEAEQQQQQLQLNWAGGWASANQMGGPLAEALRSSTSTSSPTSVLHQLPRSSGSETSYIST